VKKVFVTLLFVSSVHLGWAGTTSTTVLAQDPDAISELLNACTPPIHEEMDVRPYGPIEAIVEPAVSNENPDHVLYLVEIILQPEECVTNETPGNQRFGAVVLMVQQGKVAYRWSTFVPAPGENVPVVPQTEPEVVRGDLAQVGNRYAANGVLYEDDGVVLPDDPQILYPGDWLTQDQRVDFTYRNIGSEPAVILKAVYAVAAGGGCRGGCK
jgi:hypothetical protein